MRPAISVIEAVRLFTHILFMLYRERARDPRIFFMLNVQALKQSQIEENVGMQLMNNSFLPGRLLYLNNMQL